MRASERSRNTQPTSFGEMFGGIGTRAQTWSAADLAAFENDANARRPYIHGSGRHDGRGAGLGRRPGGLRRRRRRMIEWTSESPIHRAGCAVAGGTRPDVVCECQQGVTCWRPTLRGSAHRRRAKRESQQPARPRGPRCGWAPVACRPRPRSARCERQRKSSFASRRASTTRGDRRRRLRPGGSDAEERRGRVSATARPLRLFRSG